MKWIGEHIWDLISRFRNDVYIDGDLSVTGNAKVDGAYYDSANSPGTGGQVLTSTATGTDWIDATSLPSETAEKVIQPVRFGEAVAKGDPLVITGYHGSQGPAIVEKADAADSTKMPAYGVATEDYNNNATGLMIAVGDLDDFDTSSYSVGDTLYVAVGGGMTNVKPTGTGLIQNMGIVSRSNANNGDVEIVAIGRTNDVPNLPTGRLFVGTSGNTSLTSDVVYIDDTSDRVGIGTASPDEKLDVTGDIKLSGDIELGHASDTTIARASAGKVTIEGQPIQTKQMSMTHHNFFMNSASITVDFFFPYNNLNEANSTSQYYTRTIAPYAGKIVKVIIRPSAAIGTACKLQFHKITNTDLNFGTAVEEVTNVNLNTAETSVSTAFSSATFAAGDVVNVSLIKSEVDTANIQAVIVWEYTI